jgi:hypothetical protein
MKPAATGQYWQGAPYLMGKKLKVVWAEFSIVS